MGVDYRVMTIYGWKLSKELNKKLCMSVKDDIFGLLEDHLFYADGYQDFREQECIIGILIDETDDCGVIELDYEKYFANLFWKYYLPLFKTIPKEVINIIQKEINIIKPKIYIMYQIW